MNILSMVLCFFMFQVSLIYATPTKIVDGKVSFAVATVNGRVVWTEAEKQGIIDSYNALPDTATVTVTVIDLSPTSEEVAVSTTIGKFSNYSDWISYFDRSGLDGKEREILQENNRLRIIQSQKERHR